LIGEQQTILALIQYNIFKLKFLINLFNKALFDILWDHEKKKKDIKKKVTIDSSSSEAQNLSLDTIQ